MFDRKVDYHIHTSFSDGTYTPTEIVKKYAKEEYDEIAITDHDGIGGVKEAKIAGEALDLKVIPGIEFSTSYNGHGLHLLGYNYDMANVNLVEKIIDIRDKRDERNEILARVINDMGYKFKLEDVYAKTAARYVGKPNIARHLVEKGYFKTFDECFSNLMESPEVKGIRKEKIDIKDAIKLINDAGGQAVLAHPLKIKFLGEVRSPEFYEKLSDMLSDLKQAGLKGMECFYPIHTTTDEFNLSQLAGKYHLHMTKGSDFHGDK